ncbi:MAG: glutathione S-transferase [Sandaracinaceae bacterium]|nr:glutathione S-transferase [Sandaracinaceae bacterium]
MLRELEYAIESYARTDLGRAPPELRKIHPLGKSPVLQHGDVLVAESGAIVEHVLDELADGRLRPAPGTEDLRRYRFFLHFAEGSMMAPLLVKLVVGRLRKAVPLLGSIIANKVDAAFTVPEIRAQVSFVDSELASRPWLAGDDLTGADIMMSYPLMAARARGGLEAGAYPNLDAYLARIEARPAWQRATERGGGFSIAD